MDRNIITWIDTTNRSRSTADTPGGFQVAGKVSQDDYWSRLVKYVPIEMIGAYVLIEGLVDSAYQLGDETRNLSLGVLVVAGMVGTWFFAKRVLGVVRWQQNILSVIGFLVWSFATGGYFSVLDWYKPWMGTATVVLFGVTARIVDLPPLPDDDVAHS